MDKRKVVYLSCIEGLSNTEQVLARIICVPARIRTGTSKQKLQSMPLQEIIHIVLNNWVQTR